MAEFRVMWEIDIEAETALGAAIEARQYQLDPEAKVGRFTIICENGEKVDIDLNEGE